MRRVVVTGIGTVNPAGCSVESSWNTITSSKSAICKIQHINVEDIASKIAGMVPSQESGNNVSEHFQVNKYVSDKERARIDAFTVYAIAAADQACEHAGLHTLSDEQKERAGVSIGSGIGGLPCIEDTVKVLESKGAKRVSPFFIPTCLINIASGHVSIKHGLRGPNLSVVTACATGSHAISDAARMIRAGEVDIMVCGGAESTICRLALSGFCALKALSSHYNDTPHEASRPWDKGRDGFVMGEGAGVLVLEEYEHAKKRGANILAEIVGYGLSGDAHHITAPCDDGSGALLSMQRALHSASLNAYDIGYINAHGTSTGLGDVAELQAVTKLYNNNVSSVKMSSTKSAIGHLLGGSGAVEAIFSIMALRSGILPPTLNLHDPEETNIDLIPLTAKEHKVKYVMSNSFGFGGTNCSVIFGAI